MEDTAHYDTQTVLRQYKVTFSMQGTVTEFLFRTLQACIKSSDWASSHYFQEREKRNKAKDSVSLFSNANNWRKNYFLGLVKDMEKSNCIFLLVVGGLNGEWCYKTHQSCKAMGTFIFPTGHCWLLLAVCYVTCVWVRVSPKLATCTLLGMRLAVHKKI